MLQKIAFFWILNFFDFCSPWTRLAFKMKSPAEDLIRSKLWVALSWIEVDLNLSWSWSWPACPSFLFLPSTTASTALLLYSTKLLHCTVLILLCLTCIHCSAALLHRALHCDALHWLLLCCRVLLCNPASAPSFQLSAAPRPSFMGQEWPLGHFPLLVRDPLCVKLSYWLVDNAAQRDQILLAVFMDCKHCSG